MQTNVWTSGVTGALLLYHLARNPDKQEILYKVAIRNCLEPWTQISFKYDQIPIQPTFFQEIKEHVGPDGSVSVKALSKLKYLQVS